jgi:hypothetical protein
MTKIEKTNVSSNASKIVPSDPKAAGIGHPGKMYNKV